MTNRKVLNKSVNNTNSENSVVEALFGNNNSVTSNKEKWYYNILPHIKKQKEFSDNQIDILEEVKSLLETGKTEENIELCKKLTNVHRIIENTHARRRLEKKDFRIIKTYLIIVGIIFLASYINIDVTTNCFLSKVSFSVSDSVIKVLLTTTTANIIGLGLIVLRGHFLANQGMEDRKNNLKNTKSQKK